MASHPELRAESLHTHSKSHCMINHPSATGDLLPFPFLRLPPEIRVMIYKMLLCDERAICVGYSRGKLLGSLGPAPGNIRGRSPLPRGYTSILRVNRSMFHETATVLYGFNTFKVSYHRIFCEFLKAIATSRRLLRYVELVGFPSYDFDLAGCTRHCALYLMEATKLKRCIFDHQETWENFQRHANHVFENFRLLFAHIWRGEKKKEGSDAEIVERVFSTIVLPEVLVSRRRCGGSRWGHAPSKCAECFRRHESCLENRRDFIKKVIRGMEEDENLVVDENAIKVMEHRTNSHLIGFSVLMRGDGECL